MDNKKLYCVGLFIAVLAFPIFGCVFEWRPDMITPYLLFLTLAAIFWYSYETRGLKNQMVLQNELSLRPQLIFVKEVGGRLLVRNIGNGAALDIRIEDYVHELPGPGERIAISFRFECQNILDTDWDSEIMIRTGDGQKFSDAAPADYAQLERHTFELTLKYKNVLGQDCSNRSRLGKEMLRLTSFRR